MTGALLVLGPKQWKSILFLTSCLCPVPTELPEHLSTHPTEGGVLASTQAAVTEGFPSSTALPPSTEPATTPAEATTQAVPEDTTVVVAETSTPDVPTAAQQPLTSDPVTPAAGTEEPTEVVETVQTAVGKVVEAEVDEEVVVEDDAVGEDCVICRFELNW